MNPFAPERVAGVLREAEGLVATPDSLVMLPSDPRVQAWLAKAPAGIPVTIGEHNAMVASLAYMEGVFALGEAGITSFGVGRSPEAFYFGGRDFTGGTIVAPTATAYAPSGVAAPMPAPPVPPSLPAPAATQQVDVATRREALFATRALLEALVVTRDRVLVSTDATVAPAGVLPAAAPWIIGAVVFVVVVGIGARAVVEVNESTQREITGRVKIQEEAHTARAAAAWQAKLNALQQRLAGFQATGRLAPPSPIETEPTAIAPTTNPAPGATPGDGRDLVDKFTDSLVKGGIYLGVGTALVLGGSAVLEHVILPRVDRALGGK